MPDIRVVQRLDFPELAVPLDWSLLPNGTLDTSNALATAIIVALGTDRLALATDPLPIINDFDRRGWWGDMDAQEIWGAWPIGWRGWLLERAKITDVNARNGATVMAVQTYLQEALEPFVTIKVISNYDLFVTRNAYNRQRIDAEITLYRPVGQPPITLAFQLVWTELGFNVNLV